jgi:predicted transcriptional regulator
MKPEPSIFDEIDQAAEDAADAEGLADAAAGRLIPHEEVGAWLDTWGAPGSKPAPTPSSSGLLRRSAWPRD